MLNNKNGDLTTLNIPVLKEISFRNGDISLVDVDNDGDLDIHAIGGKDKGFNVIFNNLLDKENQVAFEEGNSMEGLINASADWGDWNGDGEDRNPDENSHGDRNGVGRGDGYGD